MTASQIAQDVDFSDLPTDLYSDEPELETYLHLQQLILFLSSLEWHWQDRQDFFAAGNLTVYYSPKQIKNRDFRGPDFFVALNTQRYPRKSWVVWEEDGKYPDIIFEVLSNSTAQVDRTTKKDLYQNTFRTPEYFWFDPELSSLEFTGFVLMGGQYQPIERNEQGWMWSGQLQLFVGLHGEKVRFFTPEGELVLTPTEAAMRAQSAVEVERNRVKAEQEKLKAETEKLKAEREKVKAEKVRGDRLAQKLKELGIELDEV